MVNIGKNILLDYDTGSYVMYNNEVYELDKLSFFVPAAHKLDGFTYPLEINFNHRSPDTGKLLIISVLAEISDATSKSRLFLDMIADNLPKSRGLQTHVNTPDEWNCFNLVPDAKSFYAYKVPYQDLLVQKMYSGVVFENTVNCSTKFYDAIKPIIQGNPRSIQKLNGRRIFFNPNNADKNKEGLMTIKMLY